MAKITRTEYIGFWATKDNKEKWFAEAHKHGRSLSQHIRECLNHNNIAQTQLDWKGIRKEQSRFNPDKEIKRPTMKEVVTELKTVVNDLKTHLKPLDPELVCESTRKMKNRLDTEMGKVVDIKELKPPQ